MSMDMTWLGQAGFALPLGLGAIGSALGIGAAGSAAAGAWAKLAKQGKTLDAKYLAMIGMPLSQTLYGFLVMFVILKTRVYTPELISANAGAFFSIGLAAGLGELFSAWLQGVIGASGIRAMSESEGAPFAFTMIAMGIVETVGIFSFVLMFLMLPKA